jgi:hypothetical protein
LYWSATTTSHVPYESRLELARLLCADFDVAVTAIVAQPFLLCALVDGQRRKHVPDYLLFSDDGPIVVDVKPRARLEQPRVSFTLSWTVEVVVTSRGWRYEVASGPPDVELGNLRFLAHLSGTDLDGLTVAEATRSVNNWDTAAVRAAVFHLLWRQVYRVDLTRPLSLRHCVTTTAAW